MERLTIIGSGTMGHSITLCAAWAGLYVNMFGLSDADIAAGMDAIEKKLANMEKSDLLKPGEKEGILRRIMVATSIDSAVKDASFVIECIPEDVKLKNEMFQQLDIKCHPDVVLASNTSGLRLSDISKGTVHSQRILITHFWNPAHLIPLVEVLRSSVTKEVVFQRTMDLLTFMGKKTIEIKKEIEGLVGNRLQFALFREAQHLLDQGIASKEDIDSAVTYGIGRRLSVSGPIMSADLGGLDIFNSVSNNLFRSLSNAKESYPTLRDLVSEVKLGDKSGQGYYQWNDDFSRKMNEIRELELIRLMKEDKLVGNMNI